MLPPYAEEITGIIIVVFDTSGQVLITFCVCQILKKKWYYNGAVHQLFIDFMKAYDSVRRGGLV
jgi:hypothetical protein